MHVCYVYYLFEINRYFKKSLTCTQDDQEDLVECLGLSFAKHCCFGEVLSRTLDPGENNEVRTCQLLELKLDRTSWEDDGESPAACIKC